MIQAFYSATSGLRARQTAMDTIGNDIANVNTAGYTQKETQFSDLIYNSMVRPENPQYEELGQGSGAAANAEVLDTSEGSLVSTGQLTDYAANDGGFFAVRDDTGNVFYTRSGTFAVKSDGNGGYVLADEEGRSVLDADGQEIAVADGVPQETPGVFTFENPAGLTQEGDTLFSANALSGDAQVSDAGVQQGYYMASNTDLSQQMTRMILTQRGFQMNARIISTADQIESITNDLH